MRFVYDHCECGLGVAHTASVRYRIVLSSRLNRSRAFVQRLSSKGMGCERQDAFHHARSAKKRNGARRSLGCPTTSSAISCPTPIILWFESAIRYTFSQKISNTGKLSDVKHGLCHPRFSLMLRKSTFKALLTKSQRRTPRVSKILTHDKIRRVGSVRIHRNWLAGVEILYGSPHPE